MAGCFVRLALGAAALLAFSASAIAGNNFCRFPPITYCDGCVLDRAIVVHPGSTCVFISYIGNGAFVGHDFITKPTKGHFGAANRSTVAYQAPAIAGDDYFEYAINWNVAVTKQRVVIRNRVTIDPSAQ